MLLMDHLVFGPNCEPLSVPPYYVLFSGSRNRCPYPVTFFHPAGTSINIPARHDLAPLSPFGRYNLYAPLFERKLVHMFPHFLASDVPIRSHLKTKCLRGGM